MKTKLLTLLLLLVNVAFTFAQNFEDEIEKSAREMAVKLNHSGNIDVAIYPFYAAEESYADLSVLISEELSIDISKYKTGFKIIDRSYLEQMMQEHRLNSEGLIDPKTAKKFGMIIAADYYVTGKVYLIDDKVRVQIFVINTETGERLYSDFAKFFLDKTLATIAGIKNYKEVKDESDLYESKNPKCAEQNVGNYCFVNNTNHTIYISISSNNYGSNDYISKRLDIASKDKACLFDLPESLNYSYSVYFCNPSLPAIGGCFPEYSGSFYVKTCKSDFKKIGNITPKTINNLINTGKSIFQN